jgi:hypothetical protein
MPVSYTIAALFPQVCDFRFTEVTDPTTENYAVGGVPQFDQLPLDEMAQDWQTPLPYYQKKTFDDKCTVMVLTNRVAAGATYPALTLETATTAIPLSLPSGIFINGAQRITGLTIPYVNPDTFSGTATDIPADIFQWQFYMSQILDPLTDSGVVYLRMRVYGDDALTVYREYLSEPIMVYDSFPGTVLVESKNVSTRLAQGIVTTGWNDGQVPTFQHRVEGMPLQYAPAGVAVTYLQQMYLNKQLNAQNFRTFIFRAGAVSAGVPAYMIEKLSEAFITDLWKINNKYFIANIDENGGVSNFWKIEDSETALLVVGEIPIRERYMGQNALVVATPTPDLELYTSPGFPYAICPWALNTGGEIVLFDHEIIEDLAGENAQIAAWNVQLSSAGAVGTIVRTTGVLYYTGGIGVPSLFTPVRLLTKIVDIVYYREPLGGGAGYLVAGVAGVHVFDWGDATPPTYVAVTGGSIYPQTHTYAASVGADYACRMFHDDLVGGIYFIETGVYYPSPCKFVDITGELPTGLFVLNITNCNFFGSLGLSIDLSPCAILADLIIRNCTLIPNFAGVFAYPNPILSEILLGGNPLTAGGVDGIFVDFVANTWDGILTGGLINVFCSPPQPPTAASLAARNALIAKGWTLNTD